MPTLLSSCVRVVVIGLQLEYSVYQEGLQEGNMPRYKDGLIYDTADHQELTGRHNFKHRSIQEE